MQQYHMDIPRSCIGSGKGLILWWNVLNNFVYKIKQDAIPHKQHMVHFDRFKPYLHRAEQREEAGSTQQDDVPGEMLQEEEKADSGERRAPQDEEDEMYGMLEVQNRAAQLAPADTENQEPVGDNHENPAMEDDIQDDDMEPQQVEQVPLHVRRSSRKRQPPERLGSWTYF